MLYDGGKILVNTATRLFLPYLQIVTKIVNKCQEDEVFSVISVTFFEWLKKEYPPLTVCLYVCVTNFDTYFGTNDIFSNNDYNISEFNGYIWISRWDNCHILITLIFSPFLFMCMDTKLMNSNLLFNHVSDFVINERYEADFNSFIRHRRVMIMLLSSGLFLLYISSTNSL